MRPLPGGQSATSGQRSAWRAARLPFTLLSLASVALGSATATAAGATPAWWRFALCALAAVAAHVSVNALNDYEDFQSGLDRLTVRTPFSGGSGALVEHPEHAAAVRALAFAALATAVFCGGVLVALSERPGTLLTLGILGCLLILGYTRWLNRQPWLCLVAPGLGVGALIVGGTHLALGAAPGGAVLLAALVPFALANGLLLLNQLPDLDADRVAGRRHLALVHGVAASLRAYRALALVAVLAIVLGVISAGWPATAQVALLPLLATPAIAGAAGRALAARSGLVRVLAANVAVCLLTPALLAAALIHG